MELMTTELQRSLPSTERARNTPSEELMVKAKFFTPDAAATWYIAGYDPDTRLLYGLADLGPGFYPESGDISLAELESVRGAFGLPVERDLYWQERPMSDVLVTV